MTRRAASRLLSLACLLLGGCAGLLHSNATPEQTYYLRAPSQAVAAPTQMSLRVGHPSAAPGLDSPHIMLLQADHRLDFYTGSRWAAPAPEVVEALAAQTLRASQAFTSVEDSTSPFPSEYLLQISLRRFEADYTSGGPAPSVYVVLDCIVGRREGREVVGTFEVSGSAAAGANRLSEVVAAFEQASASALGALTEQVAQAVRSDAQRQLQNADSPPPSSRR
jgi:cholesterol transport system auxiliary component